MAKREYTPVGTGATSAAASRAGEKTQRGFRRCQWPALVCLALTFVIPTRGAEKPGKVSTPHELFTLKGLPQEDTIVVFSADGKRLATAWDDHTARMWDASDGKQLGIFKGHSDKVRFVRLSPDSRRLATTSDDQTAKIWDAQTGRELLTLHTGDLWEAEFSPDGKRLATGAIDGTTKIWDTSDGHTLLTLKASIVAPAWLMFSPEGKRLALSQGSEVRMCDAATGQELHTFKGQPAGLTHYCFSPSGERLAAAVVRDGGQEDPRAEGKSGQELLQAVKIWDVRTGRELLTLKTDETSILCMTFSPDGRRIVCSSGCGPPRFSVWDADTGRRLLALKGDGAVFSPDGKRLASCSGDNTVKLWDARSGKELAALKGHTGPLSRVVFNADGKRLASVSNDGIVKVWDVGD